MPGLHLTSDGVLPPDRRPGFAADAALRALPVLSLLLLVAAGLPLHAQEPAGAALEAPAVETERPAPRVIAPDDYARWERFGGTALSPDGRWFAYQIHRVDEDQELRIRLVDTDSVIVVPWGAQPVFSEDGRWLAFSVGVSPKERRRSEAENRPVRRSMALLDLRTGERTDVEAVRGFRFSDDGAFLAMSRHGPDGERDWRGTDLVVRSLADDTDTNFGNIAEYAWAEGRPLLAMIVDAEGRAGNGVRIFEPATGMLRTLHGSGGTYRDLVWREDQPGLAVLKARDSDDHEDPAHLVLAWRRVDRPGATGHVLDPAATDGFPEGMRIVEHRPLRWSKSGPTLFFGIADWPEKETEAEEDEDAEEAAPTVEEADGASPTPGEREDDDGEDEPDEDVEAPGLQIWHSRDVDPVPAQRLRAVRDREANHLSAWHLDDGRFVRLADEDLDDVRLDAQDRLAVGRDPRPYDLDRMFGPEFEDIYVVDIRTGNREKVKERVEYAFGASPGGKYLLYLEDDHYWTYDVARRTHIRITEDVPTSFVNLESDRTVDQKPPFGVAGWTQGDEFVLLYDKYDVWRVRPDGRNAVNLTGGAEEEVRHRLVRFDWSDPVIDLREPLYFHVFGEWTKRSGYARLRRGARAPETLVFEDRSVTRLSKADDADVYVFSRESFQESPNYYVAGPDLSAARRVTDTNPFQSEFAWGRGELIDYENRHGVPLQAALFYPADYEPGRRYPMIVYPYERRSGTLHQYVIPSERHPYNAAVWTARGYFVLAPDIVYRPRNPGISAIEALEPAVEAALATGMIDPERVGLIGHSWGGYQTTFAVTQTDMFAAAVAGAPLTNLISMYLSMYWNTGGTDARIFEISQGRMEVPWWEDYESYIANSPVHHIVDMNTPLLMMFGTEDGAVEFNQGVEFYNAARRAGKDFVLLVYESENHSLANKANQIDYHRRVNEWFAHYLKGEPAPKWITEGVPFLEQEEKLKKGPAAGRR